MSRERARLRRKIRYNRAMAFKAQGREGPEPVFSEASGFVCGLPTQVSAHGEGGDDATAFLDLMTDCAANHAGVPVKIRRVRS